jgi:hypothetical protein
MHTSMHMSMLLLAMVLTPALTQADVYKLATVLRRGAGKCSNQARGAVSCALLPLAAWETISGVLRVVQSCT